MSLRGRRALSTRTLAAYLEGALTQSEARTLEAQLAQSTDAQRALAELSAIRDGLSAPIPELENVDLRASVRRAVEEPATRSVRPKEVRWYAWSASAAALVAAAYVVMLARAPRVATDHTEFRAKPATTAPADPARWSGIRAYRVRGEEPPTPLAGALSTHDGLLFSYSNLGDDPFKYLMIFAVDGAKQVRWFYPAYQVPGTNPSALAIESGQSERVLPEVVEHDFARGPLRIFALFMDEPLSVSDVEARVSQLKTTRIDWPTSRVRVQSIEAVVAP